MGFARFVLWPVLQLKPRSTEARSGVSPSLHHFSSSSPLCFHHPIPRDRFLSINFAFNSSLWFLFIFPLSSSFIYCFFTRLQIKTLETLSMAMKPHGKSIMSSDSDEKSVFFKDLSLGPNEAQLKFRLIHFWEAWNPVKKTLIGMEMLLIDEQGTVIQGFISPGRIEKYLPDMKRGSVYKLNNFYGSRNKSVFRVADHTVTVSFSWNSELKVLLNCPTHFDADSFRFHSYEEFQANCDLKGDLYDVVGHMKLVNGQSIVEAPVLDEVEIAKARRVLIHPDPVLIECQANGNEGVNLEAPVPEALISTIGQKHKFCVKVTEHNFSGKTRSLTVTKILPLDPQPTTVSSEDNHTAATSEETSENRVDSADGSKRTCDSSELERVKRPKCGN
ncbi:hypothetical protein YC2023_081057 [Brassica napus]